MFVFQLDYPNMMEGLMLLNINPCAEGWMDWAAHKVTHTLIKGLYKALKEEIHLNSNRFLEKCSIVIAWAGISSTQSVI